MENKSAKWVFKFFSILNECDSDRAPLVNYGSSSTRLGLVPHGGVSLQRNRKPIVLHGPFAANSRPLNYVLFERNCVSLHLCLLSSIFLLLLF